MPVDLSRTLVIGVTSSALFDMTEPNRVFEEQGLDAYTEYQLKHANDPLPAGTGLPLVKAVLRLNEEASGNPNSTRRTDVVVASKNDPSTSERLYHSIEHHGLDGIQRSFLVGGQPVAPYLGAFSVDLFLSTSHSDVESALDVGIPAAVVYAAPENPTEEIDQIRIAFDGDAVLFSDESEAIYKKYGLGRFIEHETSKANVPLPEGPFFKLLKVLSFLQNDPAYLERPPVRIALVTARSMPSHKRVIKTLKLWGVRVDEAFFMGGVPKTKVLSAFKPHIFFDDQDDHCQPASVEVPTARVPNNLTDPQRQLFAERPEEVGALARRAPR
ncbi:MAG: 5'-nucleotidase [Planctomycetota bacterium]